MTTKSNYSTDPVMAARSVMIEVMHSLGAYRDDIVIIGGWVPGLLIQDTGDPHIGSTDVDIAIDHQNVSDEEYSTIRQLLFDRGYSQGKQPFIFLKDVTVNDVKYTVQVDLLAGEYEGTGKKHRTQRIQNGRARKVRGCDLAFRNPVVKVLEGRLPDKSLDSVDVQVSSIIPFLAMKGMALNDRIKAKDSWDIYYCVKNYPGGIEALVGEYNSYKDHGLIVEGFEKIARKFESINHTGPSQVAEFEEIEDAEEIEIIKRDAFQRINELLKRINII